MSDPTPEPHPDVFRNRRMRGATFVHVDLGGAHFDEVDLRDASIRLADLTGVRVRAAELRGMRMTGVEVIDTDIDGEIAGLRINGIDVTDYVRGELERLHPDLRLMRPDDADGFRRAWALLGERWDETVARARRLEPGMLHERVDDEWSFIETLRHLVFATEAWVHRALLGDPSPWHPLSLPWDEAPDIEGVPRDRTARPSLGEVLALREERRAGVTRYLETLTDEDLTRDTTPVDAPGWPESVAHGVRTCLLVVLNEEWWHRHYAERDLAALRERAGRSAG